MNGNRQLVWPTLLLFVVWGGVTKFFGLDETASMGACSLAPLFISPVVMEEQRKEIDYLKAKIDLIIAKGRHPSNNSPSEQD